MANGNSQTPSTDTTSNPEVESGALAEVLRFISTDATADQLDKIEGGIASARAALLAKEAVEKAEGRRDRMNDILVYIGSNEGNHSKQKLRESIPGLANYSVTEVSSMIDELLEEQKLKEVCYYRARYYVLP